jgi:hypothetical protein
MSIDLNQLLQSGVLTQVEVDLGPRRQSLRRVLVTKEFKQWTDGLSTARSPQRMFSEHAELVQALSDFIGRAKLGGVITGVNPPAGAGIFKIKTPQFRLFGWAADQQTLVLALGVRKDDLAAKRVVERECGPRVVVARKALGIVSWQRGQWYEIFRISD